MSGETIEVDISGLGVRFEGLTRELAQDLEREWRQYVRPTGGAAALVVRVEDDAREMTPGRFMDGTLRFEARASGMAVRRDEGELVHDAPGPAAVARLARGDRGRRFWGLANLTCAAVSFRLQERGGGVVHAAGVVSGARAYLMVGPSGCGKTTWARTAAEAGLAVLSDDCVPVESSGGALVALGSPFRAKDFPAPGPGRWPVGAILVPRWADEPALLPVTRLMLEARIAANLLFASPEWDAHAQGGRAAAAIAAGAPARVLAFRPDGSWIPLLATLP